MVGFTNKNNISMILKIFLINIGSFTKKLLVTIFCIYFETLWVYTIFYCFLDLRGFHKFYFLIRCFTKKIANRCFNKFAQEGLISTHHIRSHINVYFEQKVRMLYILCIRFEPHIYKKFKFIFERVIK